VGKRKREQAGNGTVQGYWKNAVLYRACGDSRSTFLVLGSVRVAGATKVLLAQRERRSSSGYSFGAAATERSSRRSGRTEKNLCRQGAQRNAWIPSKRPTVEVTPVMRSAEIRCNSRLPQILQCACKKVRNGIKRARNRVVQVSHRQGRIPTKPKRWSCTDRRLERRMFAQ